MTSPDAPIPRARPLTKAALPAPIWPESRTRSPRRTWRASRAAAASVSSGDPVMSPREPGLPRRRRALAPSATPLCEVVVATLLHFHLTALSVQQHHPGVGRELPHPVQPRRKLWPAAHQLNLLAAGHRLLGRRPLGPRHRIPHQPRAPSTAPPP